MPNRLGGKKFKRGKKFSKFNSKQTREMVYKETDQEYCRIERNLGERRFEILCADGVTRLAHVPGCFHKRLWFNVGDYALVSKRSFEPDKCDFCYKYFPGEVEQLRAENRLGRLTKDDNSNDMEEDHEFDDLIDGVDDSKTAGFFTKTEDDDFFTKTEEDDFFTKTKDDMNIDDL